MSMTFPHEIRGKELFRTILWENIIEGPHRENNCIKGPNDSEIWKDPGTKLQYLLVNCQDALPLLKNLLLVKLLKISRDVDTTKLSVSLNFLCCLIQGYLGYLGTWYCWLEVFEVLVLVKYAYI